MKNKPSAESILRIQRQQLRRALEVCIRALTDETGNVPRREYDAVVEARVALEVSQDPTPDTI